MSIDQTKFHYEQTNIPNVLIKYNKERAKIIYDQAKVDDPNANVSLYGQTRIASDIVKLIETLAKDKPQWTFVGVVPPSAYHDMIRGDIVSIESFSVLYKDEQLGHIRIRDHWTRREKIRKYEIGNQRIASKRERGSAVVTKDMVRAIRVVNKLFGSKTVSERLDEIESNIVHHMSAQQRNHTRTFENEMNQYVDALQSHILLNLDKYNDIALPHLKDKSIVETLPKVYDHFEIAQNICMDHPLKTSGYVFLDGNEYHIKVEKTAEIKTYTTDTIPPMLKQDIGMLKLIGDGEFLRDVGYRRDENKFYLLNVDEKKGVIV